MTFGEALSVIFWLPVCLVFIIIIFTSVSGFTNGIIRSADRKQKRYYRENMND